MKPESHEQRVAWWSRQSTDHIEAAILTLPRHDKLALALRSILDERLAAPDRAVADVLDA